MNEIMVKSGDKWVTMKEYFTREAEEVITYKKRFFINKCGVLAIQGRNDMVQLNKGDKFTFAVRYNRMNEKIEERNIDYTIVKIRSYGEELQSLDPFVNGEIELVGAGLLSDGFVME